MFANWINPAAAAPYIAKLKSFNTSPIDLTTPLDSQEPSIKVALIGFGRGIEKIRNAFYKLNLSSSIPIMIDLGDVRNNDISLMTAAYQELISQGVLPIIIDPSYNPSLSIANALKALKIDNDCGLICPSTHPSSDTYNLISQLLEDDKTNRLSIIGYQKHYSNPVDQIIPRLDLAGLMSLGKLRDSLKEIEPIVRGLSSITFNLTSIRASDSIGIKNQNSIGLYAEEACKILQYAGASRKLKALHICGFDLGESEDSNAAAELIACLVWYSINGRQKTERAPLSKNEMTSYVVELEEINDQLYFWKNDNSERWWIEIPNPDIKDNLVPCSENEYTQACNNVLSDRLFHLLASH